MEKQNRKLFFLVSLPRSGNTLFTSIINQNPDIACTANSLTLDIIKDLFLLKQTDIFQNFQDYKSLDNILDNVYDLYYKDWPQRVIIDRGPVTLSGNPGNFELIKKHYKRPFKCIVLLRDLIDVLASYMKWYTENPDAFPNRFAKTDEDKLNFIMDKKGAVIKDLKAIGNAFKNPSICHFVKYNDLVAKPKEEIDKIYKFMDMPYYNHRFDNLQQVEVNGIKYDDTIVGKNMHNVRSVVRKVNNIYIERIPKSIRDKYEKIKF